MSFSRLGDRRKPPPKGMDEGRSYRTRVLSAITEIPAAEWDACAGRENPFLSHAFLASLEKSGAATAETGWAPQHLVVEDEGGRLVGCTPAYLKGHSFGEYVFDHGWADAYESAGGRYYPKLQISVPFTPVPGRRFLIRPSASREEVTEQLLGSAIAVARHYELSSAHITFCTKDEARFCRERGLLLRTGEQFHWENRGYRRFDDFLADLASRKRKAVKRERREALGDDLTISVLTGGGITEHHWDAMYRFYRDTGNRKWGRPYLNRAFFSELGESLADKVVLIFAMKNGRPIAGALNLEGMDTLYGRYWGAIEDRPFLHFEICYYRAIDYAIDHGLARVEAGAQGPHKLARGYRPKPTYSAHWIADTGLADAVRRFLERERRAVAADIAALDEHAPFRKDSDQSIKPD